MDEEIDFKELLRVELSTNDEALKAFIEFAYREWVLLDEAYAMVGVFDKQRDEFVDFYEDFEVYTGKVEKAS